MTTHEYWFDKPPAAIHESRIRETIDTDILVLGSGVAGVVATLSAAETGCRVLQIEKGSSWHARGRGNFAFGSRMRPPCGPDNPNASALETAKRRNAIVQEIMEYGGYRGDQRIANFLVDNAGTVYDWLIDLAEEKGIEIEARQYDTTNAAEKLNVSGSQQFFYDIIFQPEGQITMVKMVVEEIAKRANVDVRYNTRGVQLLLGEEGNVVGVIAKDKEGYIQIKAKATILATGGYEWDPEMIEKYGGMAIYLASCCYENELNTGDGQKMGAWIGARLDEAPHCMMYEDGGGYHLATEKYYGVGVARKPWLAVNMFGERMDNEDKVWPMLGGSDLYKPGHIKFSVWDDRWRDEAREEDMGNAHSYFSKFHGYTREFTEEKIRDGSIMTADTLVELAKKMGVNEGTFLKTVERYNWICEQGYDYDFNKPKEFLKPLEKPPFYAAKMGAALLVSLGGLKINTKMEVLGQDWMPIKGLYAAGNVSGNLFFNDYPENIPGLSHARAAVFGYHAAKNAYKECVVI